jgi:nucleotide-binding universal stress UspA family protein
MKTFKNIVVATDFSDASLVAYHYAHRLASRFGASLKVVHAFQIYVNTARPELIDYTPNFSDLQTLNEERMSNFIHETDEMPNSNVLVASRVKVTTEVKLGFAPDYLIELSNDPSVDLLVLGTSGEKTWFDRLLGSVAVEVAQKAHCPVLLVPQHADFQGFHNILYAASDDSAKHKTANCGGLGKIFYVKSPFCSCQYRTNGRIERANPLFFQPLHEGIRRGYASFDDFPQSQIGDARLVATQLKKRYGFGRHRIASS